MFARILQGLMRPDPAPIDAADAPLALAALLVRVARADDTYGEDEAARIDQVLARQFKLQPAAAQALRSEAEMLEVAAPDTVRFTRALKASVPLESRTALLTALWAVALADGARDAGEETLIRTITPLLGLTDVESALARQKAQA